MPEKTVNTTAEKVRKAAENGVNIRKVLMELFPDAFKISPGTKVQYFNGDGQYIVVDRNEYFQCTPGCDTTIVSIDNGKIYHTNANSLKIAD